MKNSEILEKVAPSPYTCEHKVSHKTFFDPLGEGYQGIPKKIQKSHVENTGNPCLCLATLDLRFFGEHAQTVRDIKKSYKTNHVSFFFLKKIIFFLKKKIIF